MSCAEAVAVVVTDSVRAGTGVLDAAAGVEGSRGGGAAPVGVGVLAEGTPQQGDQGCMAVVGSRETLGAAVHCAVQVLQGCRFPVWMGDRLLVMHGAALLYTTEGRSGVGSRGGALQRCRIVG